MFFKGCNAYPNELAHSGSLGRQVCFVAGRLISIDLGFLFRWELIAKLNEVLSANITPVVPLRGSISSSGGEFFPNGPPH
jgi:hypothetical protein